MHSRLVAAFAVSRSRIAIAFTLTFTLLHVAIAIASTLVGLENLCNDNCGSISNSDAQRICATETAARTVIRALALL